MSSSGPGATAEEGGARRIISPKQAAGQAWKFYAAPMAWIGLLVVAPAATGRVGVLAFAALAPAGAFLFTWLGFLMHECWHRYVPGLPHRSLFACYAWMLVTDPQIYRMVHGYHHTHVNTYDDLEFHPFGGIKSRPVLIASNCLEILLGAGFLTVASLLVIPAHSRFRARFKWRKTALSVAIWIVYLAGAGMLSNLAFGVAPATIATTYGALLWIGSVVVHHSQLVEHGNLFREGSWQERNLFTRNLAPSGLLEKAFLFLTHGDSTEHVLHHVLVAEYSRPFPGAIPLPPGANVISLRDYVAIVIDMLAGRPSSR